MESITLAALDVGHTEKSVRVEFEKTNDVISHTIFLVDGSEKVPVFTSRVNEPGQPCFTELHQQADTLFLTGADGPSHWSMTVERGEGRWTSKSSSQSFFNFHGRLGLNAPHFGDRADLRLLFFDVACRLSVAVPDCRSSYLLQQVSDFELQVAEGCGIVRCSSDDLLLIGNNSHPENQKFTREPRTAISTFSGGGLWLYPTDDQPTAFPTTVRWSYAVWRM